MIGAVLTHVVKLPSPEEYAGSPANLNAITLDFCRAVLGIQLFIAGVQLPSGYLKKEIKSLGILLGPGMLGMWVCSSVIIWAMVPSLPLLHAMAIAACITPTDPVLSSSIVKGRYAAENVPQELQHMIIGESGANDGLGYPFLFFALYLIRYTTAAPGDNPHDGVLMGMRQFLANTCGRVVLLSVIYGWVVGYSAKAMLQWAKKNKYVDRESFSVFAIPLALFIIGTCGIVNSDDVLACFVAGNAFTWDDWWRLKTLDDSLQDTVDMMLNMAIFLWLGAVCPWGLLWNNDVLSFPRLLLLGVAILLARRLPILLATYRHLRQVNSWRQAFFVGYFGPIGISAVFYLCIGREYLETWSVDGEESAVALKLHTAMTVLVWFLILCSVVSHATFRFFLLYSDSTQGYSWVDDTTHDSEIFFNFLGNTYYTSKVVKQEQIAQF